MNNFIAGVARAAVETFEFPGPILEVGSYQVTGQEDVSCLRNLFPDTEYVGIDMREGPGVDAVENVEALPRIDDSFGSVIALNVFEHVERFWRGFEEIQRVLRPDGILLVSCPFNFHIHAYPNDYWRFTPEALASLLDASPSKIIGYHGPRKRPLSVWALATGPEYPAITAEQHEAFRASIRQYSRQPLRWDRQIRYRLGRVLCGRGPFAPFLDAELFDTDLKQAA